MLFDQEWVVYCKRAMKTGSVIEYLGRYSHRIALTNRRIVDINEQTVRFTYKDYKQKGVKGEMTLKGEEFLRRFCLHILPFRFVRVRHYGSLAACNKAKLGQAREQIQPQRSSVEQPHSSTQLQAQNTFLTPNSFLCPHCHEAYMVCIKVISPPTRAPPAIQPVGF